MVIKSFRKIEQVYNRETGLRIMGCNILKRMMAEGLLSILSMPLFLNGGAIILFDNFSKLNIVGKDYY